MPIELNGQTVGDITLNGNTIGEVTVNGTTVYTSASAGNLPVAYSNLIAWYPFDSATYGGLNADDVTAIVGGSGDDTAYDGTVDGATYLSSDGVTDITAGSNSGAFSFDGSNDKIINTGLTRFDGSSGNDFTITGWIKPDSIGPQTTILLVEGEWHLVVDGSSGNTLRLSIFGDNNAGRTQAIPVGAWTHFAVYWNPGSQIVTHINGNLDDTYSSGTTSSGSTEMVFAAEGNFPSARTAWDGLMDDIRLYDGQLSDTQIQNIYNNTQQ